MKIDELFGEFTKMCDEQKDCSECKYADNFSLCQLSFAYSKGKADAIAEFKDLGKLYSEIRADALNIDMEKPMHFTDEQKAWVKNYIIINAKRQRADAIEEFESLLYQFGYYDSFSIKLTIYQDDLEKLIEQLKEQK